MSMIPAPGSPEAYSAARARVEAIAGSAPRHRLHFPWEGPGLVDMDLAGAMKLLAEWRMQGSLPARSQAEAKMLLTAKAIEADAIGADFLLCVGGLLDGQWRSIGRGVPLLEAWAENPVPRPWDSIGRDMELRSIRADEAEAHRVVYERMTMQAENAKGTFMRMMILKPLGAGPSDTLLSLLWSYRPDMGVR